MSSIANLELNILDVAHRVFRDELTSLEQVSSSLGEEFTSAVIRISQASGKLVCMGIGKSGHIANKAASTFASTGTAAFFVHPAECLHGDLGMIEPNDIVLALSYSGGSDEMAIILPILKRKGVTIIAITGNNSSNLAILADIVLSIKIDKEACPLGLAPTTSTTASLLMCDALAVSLLTLKDFKEDDFALSHPGGVLGRKLLTLTSDIMHSGAKIPLVSVMTNLKDVIVEINSKGFGFAAVVDNNNLLVGCITDGDLRRSLDDPINLTQVKAGDIMSKLPKVLHPTDLAVKAINLMEQYKITGFLVVEANKIVGVFNIHDLFLAKLI